MPRLSSASIHFVPACRCKWLHQANVRIHYDLSVMSMSGMGFQNKFGQVNGLSSMEFFLVFYFG